jgi:hypothetical protein
VKPDSCGVCGGDNTTCKIISGKLHQVRYGYNLVVTLPIGATNIDVRQYGSSSTDDNYLALRSHDSSYLLNGLVMISLSFIKVHIYLILKQRKKFIGESVNFLLLYSVKKTTIISIP